MTKASKTTATQYSLNFKMMVLCFALASPSWVMAAEVRELEVSHQGTMYHLHSDMFLNAPRSDVQGLLEQYDVIPRLDPDITEVELLGTNRDGTTRMRLVSNHCMWFICISYRWTQDVLTTENGDIFAKIVPGGGDLTSGWVLYRTLQSGSGTRLIVDADVEISLPLPNAIAVYFVRRKLKSEAYETASLLERTALTSQVH